MGYSLHIERPDNQISKDEWEVWVNEAPDFTLNHEWRATNPQTGEVTVIPCEAMGEWARADDGGTVAFDYSDGRITFRADSNAIEQAKQIAEALGAIVVGDEGEIY